MQQQQISILNVTAVSDFGCGKTILDYIERSIICSKLGYDVKASYWLNEATKLEILLSS